MRTFGLLISACIVNHDLYQERRDLLTDDDGDGMSEVDGDCNDQDAEIFSGAEDLCDLLDNDCDNLVDEDAELFFWYTDADGDGFGAGEPTQSCHQPSNTSESGADCDDTDEDISPAVEEVWYDGIDADCSGNLSDYDADGDGEDSLQYGGTDCDDALSEVGAGQIEGWLDDGVDNDCDGQARDPLIWQADEADTSFVGVIPGGELGRRIAFVESHDCLLMSAPYADATDSFSGVVYAASAGETGTVSVDSLGSIIINRDYIGLSNVIEGNTEGLVALSGPSTVWLLNVSDACNGDTVDVEQAASLSVESDDQDELFGIQARWLPDYRGTGVNSLAIVALATSDSFPGQGAVYIWETPPTTGGVILAEDADTVYMGDAANTGLSSVESIDAASGTPELLFTQARTPDSEIVVARLEASAPSGTLSERMVGGVYATLSSDAPRVRVIGDVDRDGDPNFVSTGNMGMWNRGDLDGLIPAADAVSTFGWETDGEWVNLVEPIGDIDGDGRADMALLSDDWPASSLQGTLGLLPADAWLSNGLNRFENLRLTAVGDSVGDSFGYRIAPTGDFDRDGHPDIAVSSYGTDENGASSGTVYLMPIPLSD